ncbi:MAG: hypothetical protein CMF94_04775 [Candidatus Marinimicrobia bacterium]|nr:hypothetical protein [Candidatus Neomarinimicrobiota bacterium]
MNSAHLFSFLFICLFVYTCEKKEDLSVIATVGNSIITDDDFISAYSNKLINTSIKDSEFERLRTVDELIRTRLFAEEARYKKLSIDSIGMDRIRLATEKALREELYDSITKSNPISVPDSLIRKHFIWKNTEILLKHIFHIKKDKLDSLSAFIGNNEKTFDQVAGELFQNNNLKKSKGTLGWVSYDVLDPNIENFAFSMPLDTIIGPIRSGYGWHILLKKDEKKQMIISEEEYQSAKYRLKKNIIKKVRQTIANDYVNDLLNNNNILINDTLVINTLNQIKRIIQKKNMNQVNSADKEFVMKDILNLKVNSNTILASYKDGNFTISDLLNYLRNSNPKLFTDNPIRAFYTCLRDKLLTNEGMRLGLLNQEKVQRKIKSSEDQFLAREFLLNTLPNEKVISIPKEDLEIITHKLRNKYTINIFHDHLNLLFEDKWK